MVVCSGGIWCMVVYGVGSGGGGVWCMVYGVGSGVDVGVGMGGIWY